MAAETADPEAPNGSDDRVDLHTHTDYSDGTLAPAALVQEAGRRGLRALGVTDHDTTAGLAEAASEAARLGLELVPGVELSTDAGDREIHLLGYFVDRDDPAFAAALAELARRRRFRIERIVERLTAAGAPVDLHRVQALAGEGTIGRPHVARAMIERGHVATVSEAFDRYLAFGRPGYVPRHRFPPEEAVALVLAARGVPVLAHPLSTGDVEATVARLVPVGLRGLEVYYGEYDEPARAALRQIADGRQLIPTGGSDYHGPGFKAGRDLGGPAVPMESVARLREAAG